MSQTAQAKELTTLHTHHVIDQIYHEDEEGYIAFTGSYKACNEFVQDNAEGCVNTYKVLPSINNKL